MKVMITGGAGYVGCCLVPALLERDVKVHVVDKLIFGHKGLADCLDQIKLEKMDITDLKPEHLLGTDAIIHLAGISNEPTADYNPDLNKKINLDATVGLANLAKQCGVRRFIFASTCSVYYTEKPDNELRNECSPIEPKAAYAWSKHQAEIQILKLADNNFCPIVLRKGTIFGYSKRMRYDLVVNAFTRDAFANGKLTIHSGGQMWRPLLYIEDAVETYKTVLFEHEDVVRGQVYNVLNNNYQVINIAREVQRIIEKRIPVNLEIVNEGNPRSYRVDGGKFHKLLNIKKSGCISDAVDKMWEVLNGGVEYDNPIYYNIRWLECREKSLWLKGLPSKSLA